MPEDENKRVLRCTYPEHPVLVPVRGAAAQFWNSRNL